jgi:hypothetical protein
VWQFKFARCPQFLEISSAVHQQFCLGVGFSLCLFTGVCFFALPIFSGEKISDLSDGTLPSVCFDDLLFVFQFCRAL